MTKLLYSEQILPVPWPFVISRFKFLAWRMQETLSKVYSDDLAFTVRPKQER